MIRTYWATKYESRSEKKIELLAAVCLMHADWLLNCFCV